MSVNGVEKFINRLQNLIQTTKDSEDITVCEAIGALEIVKLDLYQENSIEEIEVSCNVCNHRNSLAEGVCSFQKICDEQPFRMFKPKGD